MMAEASKYATHALLQFQLESQIMGKYRDQRRQEIEIYIAELEAENSALKQELAKATSRDTGIVDMEGTPIEIGDTVRVRGLYNFGVDEVDFNELCIVEKSNHVYCEAIHRRDVGVGSEMSYSIDYFELEESSEEGNDYLVVKKWDAPEEGE